ncbi:MAG: hypothetical protein FWD68_03995 [Alphaproteobacteria bacterium]|nr:hypothetical protein [Alphaproteobacteria bacterium]
MSGNAPGCRVTLSNVPIQRLQSSFGTDFAKTLRGPGFTVISGRVIRSLRAAGLKTGKDDFCGLSAALPPFSQATNRLKVLRFPADGLEIP